MRLARARALVIASAAVLLVAAIFVLARPGPGGVTTSPTPPLSATATATASTIATAVATAKAGTTPSPTPSPRAEVLDGRFGFYYFRGASRDGTTHDAVIRRETSDAEVGSFIPNDRSFVSLSRAVSPDGRFVAYWGPIQDGAVLRVQTVKDGSKRALFTAADEMSGGNFAWSSDGSGLVVALDNNMFGPGGGSALAEIWTVDLASGASEMISSRTDAAVWLPVAWDRTRNIIGAGISGEGGGLIGFDLLDLSSDPPIVRTYPTRDERSFGPFAFAMRASPDARHALTAQDDRPISWWPVADPSTRSTVEYDGIRAEWRPGTSEMWWVGGLTPAGCTTGPCIGTELVAFDVSTGQRTVMARGRFGAYVAGFRVDGSAVITASFAEPFQVRPPASDVTFVHIATGRAETFRIAGGLRESVRLD